MIGSRPGEWVAETRRLRFALGDVGLYTHRFPAVELAAHVTELPEHPRDEDAAEQLRDGVDAALIASHPVSRELPPRAVLPGAIRYVTSHHEHCFARLAPSFEEYFASLSKKARQEIRRKLRRFAAATGRSAAPPGAEDVRNDVEPDVDEYRGAERISEFYARARELARRTYLHRLLRVAMPDSEEFRAHIGEAARDDLVRGYLLEHEGRILAFGFCYARGDVLNYRYTGYDPDRAELSPGIVLLHGMLRRLHREGRFRILDFGHGDSQYKRYFSTDRVRCATLYYFRRGIKNRAVVRSHLLCRRFSDALAGAADRLGVKRRLKRLLRR